MRRLPMRLLILGTGGMANSHANAFAKIDSVEMVGAVDVDPNRARAFAAQHGIEHIFTSLEEAIAWGQFDAATNVTPDKAHHPTTLALLAAGKHVLCEKPLAENYEKAAEMAAAAERSGLVAMVNLTYRNVAPLQKARELVLAGAIGEVRHLEASYLQSWLVSKAWGDWASESQWLWRLSTRHGSNGVLGDVGIHILDFAGYGAGSSVERVFARLKTFDKVPGNRIGEYDLDANDSFAMTVEFDSGAMGVIHASRWATGHLNELRLRLHGDKGALEVIHTPDGSSLRACLGPDVEKAIWREIDAGTVPTNYERFVAAVQAGQLVEPNFRHAADLQKVLDLAIETERERRELGVADMEWVQDGRLAVGG
ncbi:gfo/Idh/MocA family oxidoreductase [Sinorhizobium fredii]|uniref:Gfo/Idh/MocA family oxidoreductase n=2 Tax=Rhizobium fredii TaxID=380 RepID=A0A844A5J8_RHIFR|nr:gfo/Idh/MocA family oxidoreductase [Sinorhizobium fredii]